MSSNLKELSLVGLVATPDGSRLIRESISGSADAPLQLGNELAEKLREAGADELLTTLFA